MLSRISMKVQRALSGRGSNARTSEAVNLSYGRAKSPKSQAASARAVRPLAASAPPERLDADSHRSTEPSLGSEEKVIWVAHSFTGRKKPIQALRRSAKPNTRGRAATSFARGGGIGGFACGVTQRTMHAGRVPQSALPNPSIERTNNGGSSLRAFANAQPPLFASHLKR